MYKKVFALLFIICLALPVFAKRQSEEIITPMSQLQKRQYQTRILPSGNQAAIMKGVLNVLQDEGYIVYNVNSLLGFIYGVKDFDTTDPNVDISKEFGLTKSRLNYNGVKVATLEVVANVTEYPDSTRIRINFKRKLLNEYGNAQFIDDVEEAEFYEDFYNKLKTAISLQKGTVNRQVTPPPVRVQKTEPVITSEEQTPEKPAANVKKEPVIVTAPAPAKEQASATVEEQNLERGNEDKKRSKEEAKALKEQQKLEKELEKEKAKQAKEQAKIEKESNKIYQ